MCVRGGGGEDDIGDVDRDCIMKYLECLPKILDCRLKRWQSHKGLEHEMDPNIYLCLKKYSLTVAWGLPDLKFVRLKASGLSGK